jgi:hypothetical protein
LTRHSAQSPVFVTSAQKLWSQGAFVTELAIQAPVTSSPGIESACSAVSMGCHR